MFHWLIRKCIFQYNFFFLEGIFPAENFCFSFPSHIFHSLHSQERTTWKHGFCNPYLQVEAFLHTRNFTFTVEKLLQPPHHEDSHGFYMQTELSVPLGRLSESSSAIIKIALDFQLAPFSSSVTCSSADSRDRRLAGKADMTISMDHWCSFTRGTSGIEDAWERRAIRKQVIGGSQLILRTKRMKVALLRKCSIIRITVYSCNYVNHVQGPFTPNADEFT